VPFAPGYFVTEDGRVFSDKRGRRRERKISINGEGYPQVCLSIDGKKRHVAVHLLIASAFLPPKPSKVHQVRHMDGNRLHCHRKNLRWGTVRDNANDRQRHGTVRRGDKHGSSKLTEKKVAAIRKRLRVGGPASEHDQIYCAWHDMEAHGRRVTYKGPTQHDPY